MCRELWNGVRRCAGLSGVFKYSYSIAHGFRFNYSGDYRWNIVDGRHYRCDMWQHVVTRYRMREMKLIFVFGFSLLTTAAVAQQMPPATPTQTALQIDNVVNAWAQQLENDQRIIAALQKENADLKAAATNTKTEPPK
jgi:hypothetical protein